MNGVGIDDGRAWWSGVLLAKEIRASDFRGSLTVAEQSTSALCSCAEIVCVSAMCECDKSKGQKTGHLES